MYMFTSLMSFLIVQIVQSWALGLYIYINILPGGTGTWIFNNLLHLKDIWICSWEIKKKKNFNKN